MVTEMNAPEIGIYPDSDKTGPFDGRSASSLTTRAIRLGSMRNGRGGDASLRDGVDRAALGDDIRRHMVGGRRPHRPALPLSSRTAAPGIVHGVARWANPCTNPRATLEGVHAGTGRGGAGARSVRALLMWPCTLV
jgi:hypothetical protein